jgi:hypothetical protein
MVADAIYEPDEHLGDRSSLLLAVTTTFTAFALAGVVFWATSQLRGVSAFLDAEQSAASDSASDAQTYMSLRPFDAAAYLALASATATTAPSRGDQLKLIEFAEKLAPVDEQVLLTRASSALLQGQVSAGLEYLADLSAWYPSSAIAAYSVLKQYVETPAWAPFFDRKLQRGWPSANQFVEWLCSSDLRTRPLLMVAGQLTKRLVPLEATVNCVVNRLISEGEYGDAYWFWLNAQATLPKSLSYVMNGDFESPQTPAAFDWQLGAGGEYRDGYTAAITSEPDRGSTNSVLAVRFNGRAIKLPVVYQRLALPPGQYRLTYKQKEIGLGEKPATYWDMRCVGVTGDTAPSFEADSRSNEGWLTRTYLISVSPNCKGQSVSLAFFSRFEMLSGMRGVAYFDDIRITRLSPLPN